MKEKVYKIIARLIDEGCISGEEAVCILNAINEYPIHTSSPSISTSEPIVVTYTSKSSNPFKTHDKFQIPIDQYI